MAKQTTISPKFFRYQLDLLLGALNEVGVPLNVTEISDDFNPWQIERIKNRLLEDNYVKQENKYDDNLFTITGKGVLFLGEGAYRKQHENKRMLNLKIKTDFTKNILFISVFILSLIANVLYLFNIINFNIVSILP